MAIFWCIILFIPIVDFFIKNSIESYLDFKTELDTVLPFLKIVNIKNFGSAFGMFGKYPQLLTIFTFVLITGLIAMVFIKKIKDTEALVAISLIVGGGAGNLVDRIFRGYVVDYLKLTFFPPICNLSDYFICIGVGLLAVYMFRKQI